MNCYNHPLIPIKCPMKMYGLQLRVQSQHKKQDPPKLSFPTHLGFGEEDEIDVEKDITRHSSKKKSFRDIDELHKKALEEDPSVFDYDGVYDKMKVKERLPRAQDHQERKPKYIQKLIEKAKVREREHEIVYDRKLAKERSVDDHLYSDKDKFVTSAYKKKLSEQAKWLEEERLYQLREEKEDVTKKSDISDFYFNLSKNIAFGGDDSAKKEHRLKEVIGGTSQSSPIKDLDGVELGGSLEGNAMPSVAKGQKTDEFVRGGENSEVAEVHHEPTPSEHHKRDVDHVAAAKERFLARKRSKVQYLDP